MSKGKICLMAALVCIFNFQVTKVRAQDTPELGYAPGELLVRFAPTTGGEQLDAASKKAILNSLGGATLKHNFRIVPGLSLIKLPSDKTVKEVLQSYNSMEGILYAEPNYKLEVFNTIPNDPRYIEQWGLHNTGQSGGTVDADIDAPQAWDIKKNADPNIIVAVIDTGVEYKHPDLAAVFVSSFVHKVYDFT